MAMALIENLNMRVGVAAVILLAAVGGCWRFNNFMSNIEKAQALETSERKSDARSQSEKTDQLVLGLTQLKQEVRDGNKTQTDELKSLNEKMDGHVRRDEWLEERLESRRMQEKIDEAQNARIAALEGKGGK